MKVFSVLEIAKMIRGEESHGSSINETPIQEVHVKLKRRKEPPHVEMGNNFFRSF